MTPDPMPRVDTSAEAEPLKTSRAYAAPDVTAKTAEAASTSLTPVTLAAVTAARIAPTARKISRPAPADETTHTAPPSPWAGPGDSIGGPLVASPAASSTSSHAA